LPARKRASIRKKPRVSESRRVFSFGTDEAEIRMLSYKGKRRIVRIRRWNCTRDMAVSDYYKMLIFHTLFPENSIKPVGVVETNDRWGVVSEILRGRNRIYKKYHDWYYKIGRHQDGSRRPSYVRSHMDFVQEVGTPMLNKIKAEAGITPSSHPANIGNVNGKPVFFEFFITHPSKLLRYIRGQTVDSTQRKRMERWVEHYTNPS